MFSLILFEINDSDPLDVGPSELCGRLGRNYKGDESSSLD